MRTSRFITDGKMKLWWQACRLQGEEFVAADTAASTEQNPFGKEHA